MIVRDRFPVSPSISYGFAHFGKTLFWSMGELVFAFFLAEIYMIDGTTLGLMIFTFLIWDAITDPILGLILTRCSMNNTMLLRMQILGATVSAISFCLVFYKPPLSQHELIIYSLVVGLVFRTAYTIYDVPQNTLLGRLSNTNNSRLFLSAIRLVAGSLATITLGLSTVSILATRSPEQVQSNFLIVAIIFSAIALISSCLLFFMNRNLPDCETHMYNFSLEKNSLDFRSFLEFSPIFLGMFFLSIGWSFFGKMIPFYSTYILDKVNFTGYFIFTIAISTLVTQFFIVKIGKSLCREKLIKFLLVFTAGTSIFFVQFANTSILSAFLSVALMASVSAAITTLIWTTLVDQLAETAYIGINDVLVFGMFTFSSKVGIGFSGLLLGMMLKAIDYAQGQILEVESQEHLIKAMGVIPFLVTLIAFRTAFRRSFTYKL